MSTVAGLRLVSSIISGGMTSASLTAAITPAQGLAGWKSAINSPVQRTLLVNDKAARTVWMGSAKAFEAWLQQPEAVRDLLRIPEAVTELVANSAALDLFWSSRIARFELWTCDDALNKFDKSALAMERAHACADVKMNAVASSAYFNFGRILFISGTAGVAGVTVSLYGRRAISSGGTTTAISAGANARATFLCAVDAKPSNVISSNGVGIQLRYLMIDQ